MNEQSLAALSIRTRNRRHTAERSDSDSSKTEPVVPLESIILPASLTADSRPMFLSMLKQTEDASQSVERDNKVTGEQEQEQDEVCRAGQSIGSSAGTVQY